MRKILCGIPITNIFNWTDIPTGRMFRYYPATNTYEQIYDDEPVGGFTIQSDGTLLLLKTEGTVKFGMRAKSLR